MLPAPGDEKESCHRGGGRSPQTGSTFVVDVDSRSYLCTAPRIWFACRVTRFSRWGVADPRFSEWVPCLPRSRGSSKNESWFRTTESNTWLVGPVPIGRLEYEPWSATAKSNSNAKTKSSGEEKNQKPTPAPKCA